METKHLITIVAIVALIGAIIAVGVRGCNKSENSFKKSRDYYNQGVANFKEGETDRAISDFNKAIKMRPSYGSTSSARISQETS